MLVLKHERAAELRRDIVSKYQKEGTIVTVKDGQWEYIIGGGTVQVIQWSKKQF